MPKLTETQLVALRAIPSETVPNRLRIAFALSGTRQADAVAETDLSAQQISQLVNGNYKAVTVAVAGALAEFFGCAIEDLFPRRQEVA